MSKTIFHGGKKLHLISEQFFKDLIQRNKLKESPQLVQTVELDSAIKNIQSSKKNPYEKAILYSKLTSDFLASRDRTKELTGVDGIVRLTGSDEVANNRRAAIAAAPVVVVQPPPIPTNPPPPVQPPQEDDEEEDDEEFKEATSNAPYSTKAIEESFIK